MSQIVLTQLPENIEVALQSGLRLDNGAYKLLTTEQRARVRDIRAAFAATNSARFIGGELTAKGFFAEKVESYVQKNGDEIITVKARKKAPAPEKPAKENTAVKLAAQAATIEELRAEIAKLKGSK